MTFRFLPSVSYNDDGSEDFYKDLSFEQLSLILSHYEKERHYMSVENEVFFQFIKKNDPKLLEDTSKIRKSLATNAGQFVKRRATQIFATKSDTMAYEIGINLIQKSKMVAGIFEQTESNLELTKKDSTRILGKLRTSMKEIAQRKLIIDKAASAFEQTVIIEGVEKITQKIPAEKYVKFLQEWQKSAQAIVQNLRLRISTTTAQHKTVSLQLERQISLGERVQLPDIEKLKIENKRYAEIIKKKNSDLLQMKISTGRSNLLLTKNKNEMQKKLKEIEKINELIKMREKKIVNLDRECKIGIKDTEIAKAKYLKLKELIESYSGPDVMDYIKIKGELNDLDRNIKRFQRRESIQKNAMKMCINEMKHLTGLKTVQPSWLIFEEENPADSEDELTLNLE